MAYAQAELGVGIRGDTVEVQGNGCAGQLGGVDNGLLEGDRDLNGCLCAGSDGEGIAIGNLCTGRILDHDLLIEPIGGSDPIGRAAVGSGDGHGAVGLGEGYHSGVNVCSLVLDRKGDLYVIAGLGQTGNGVVRGGTATRNACGSDGCLAVLYLSLDEYDLECVVVGVQVCGARSTDS